jgi:hypothetical protein
MYEHNVPYSSRVWRQLSFLSKIFRLLESLMCDEYYFLHEASRLNCNCNFIEIVCKMMNPYIFASP